MDDQRLHPPTLEECPFCGTAYDFGEMPVPARRRPDEASGGTDEAPRPSPARTATRLAFDPWKGRLWAVCAACRRWTPFPLETRWEVLEACERVVRDRGSVRLSSEHLSLVRLDEGEVVRVGRPLRVELAGWRYGERLPPPGRRGFWGRLLAGLLKLPDPPPGGYDPYGMGVVKDDRLERAWFASPFLEHASRLTYAFARIPLAPECPSCGGPVLLLPWEFQRVRWERDARRPAVAVRCALCGTEVLLPSEEARPALRLGLALVTPEARVRGVAENAAEGVEALGGGPSFLRHLAADHRELGDLDLSERAALSMVLDEEAELEALEAEWRRAEEISAILDGELTTVPGFEAFRRQVLEEGG